MRRHRFLPAAVLAAGVIAIGWTAAATAVAAEEGYWLTGPYTHNNLAIYLIHREGRDDRPVPLTLGEAMGQGLVKVIETGDVEELVIRNLGEHDVFIQSGDIVKGGKQDRVLTASMIVPPNSGDLPISAYCVEYGRWFGRGQEETTEFSASTARLPSKAGKIAIIERSRREMIFVTGHTAWPNSGRQWSEDESLQSRVWDSVREMQVNLGQAMNLDFADERSRSSLQLSLENTVLTSALEDFGVTLGRLPQEHPNAVGYVFAVGGKINSGDEFGSAGLFRKLWLRQLAAASTEAISEEIAPILDQPSLAEVAAFIDGARGAEPVSKPMPGHMSLETRETEMMLYTEFRHQIGPLVHRSFVSY